VTGIVRGFEVKTNRDSEQKVLMLQVEISGPGDIQSVEAMTFAGMQIVPPNNSIVTVVKAGNAWKIAPSQNDGIDFDSSLEEGESKIYSSNGGVEKAFIKLLKTGIIHVNGDSKDAARKDDTIKSTPVEDATFWTWLSGAAAILAGLGLAVPIPTSLTGKITTGTDKVRMP